MELKIEGMTCGGCAKSVTKAIQSRRPQPPLSFSRFSKRLGIRRP